MRIRPRLVARRGNSFLKPWYGFIPFLLFNQVSPDIVVRIAEIWIYFNRLQAFGDGAIVVAEERVRPTAERVSFGGREGFNGAGVELDGLLVLTLHLQRVRFLKVICRNLARIIFGHKRPND